LLSIVSNPSRSEIVLVLVLVLGFSFALKWWTSSPFTITPLPTE
jgi:hypothetical protein